MILKTSEEFMKRSSNFTLSLLSFKEKYLDEHASHKIHKTFLKPLLEVLDGAWVYGIKKDTEIWRIASKILVPDQKKYRIDISGDPITGYEYFWNGASGKRGTIVLTVPIKNFKPEDLFQSCLDVWVVNNFKASHTSFAITFAQQMVLKETHVVFCFPRNNGIETWATEKAEKIMIDYMTKKFEE